MKDCREKFKESNFVNFGSFSTQKFQQSYELNFHILQHSLPILYNPHLLEGFLQDLSISLQMYY